MRFSSYLLSWQITTDHGDIDTSKILFIAAGAFHHVKPSDLLAELQVSSVIVFIGLPSYIEGTSANQSAARGPHTRAPLSHYD